MKKALLTLLFAMPLIAISQSGPGGVGIPAIWLKSDAGVTFDGSNNVTAWANQGTILFSFAPGTTAPMYGVSDKSISFPSGASMSYGQTATELSSILGNGSTGQKYDVFIVGTGSSASGAYLYMGPTVPNSTATTIDHMSFGNRAMYFNKDVGAETDGEIGYYADGTSSDAQGLYAPNVGNGARGSELIINNITSHPVDAYGDINSLVFSCNGYAAMKKVDGATDTNYGSDDYVGKEQSYSTGPNGSIYQPNVSYLFLGGRPAYSGSAIIRPKGGKYFEIIVFPRKLTIDERQKVYSYLGLKYGIYLTHDQGAYTATPTGTGTSVGTGETVNNGTYFASDGTIIFKRDAYNFTDATDYKGTAASYVKDTYYPLASSNTNNSFAFVGRDISSGLDVKAVGIAAGVYLENKPKTSSFGDKQFLALSYNGASNAYSTDLVANPVPSTGNIAGRMPRTWKLTNTAFNGTFTFTALANGFWQAGSTSAGLKDSIEILVSTTPSFADGSTKAFKCSSIDANFIYFTPNATDFFGNLTPGQSSTMYLTLARLINTNNPLPVNLTSFSAVANGAVINLNWATASEFNSNRFDVTRSADGQNFTKIGSVKTSGNSNSIRNYSFTDVSPLNGINYYQLQQVDVDSRITKSAIKAATILSASKTALQVIGLSATGLSLDIYTTSATTGKLIVSNIFGQKITTKTLALDGGNTMIQVPLNMAAGVYVVTFTTAETTISKKFIKQ